MSQHQNLFNGIDTIIVRVADITAATNWYKEKLGFTAAWEDANLRLAVLDPGGPTSLTLWQTDGPIQNNGRTAAYPVFGVKNAAACRNALQQRGVQTGDIIDDGTVTYFVFYDSDGNVLEACQAQG